MNTENALDTIMRKAQARMQHHVVALWVLRAKCMKGKLRNRKSKLRKK